MTYNPNQYMNYEAGRGSIYSAPPKAKSSNANEEAAKSMGSVGIGGLGGKTTTSSAQKIQSDFMKEFRKKDKSPPSSGLGAPTVTEPEEDDRNLDQKIYDMIKSFGGNLDPDPEPVYPMEVYESYMFRIPDPVEVTQETLADPFDAYNVDTYNFGNYNYTEEMSITSPYTSQTEDPDMQDPRRGLMRPPTMSQPSTPEELTDVPRALAVSAAIPTETYLIKEGDTLSEIARDNNTTVEAIMKANSQIVDKDEIDAGATIEIPKEDDGLTPTQRALRAGLDKDKDMDGVETASLGDFFKSIIGMEPAPKVGLMANPNNVDPTGLEGPEQLQDFTDVKTAQIKLAELGYDIGRGGTSNLKNLKIVNDAIADSLKYENKQKEIITPSLASVMPSEVRGADGIKGKNTTAAIKEFQKDNNLMVTGKLDASTVAALSNPKKPTLKMDETKYSTTKQNDNMRRVRNEAMKQGIDGLELVSLMSQIAHESDNFKRTEEYASGSDYEDRKDLGNTQKGDGVKFKGRSFIQITGRNNYKKIGDKLGLDLINNPTLLEDPDTAAKATVEWWKDNVQPLVGDFSDVERVTKIINGGFNGLKDRQKKFDEFLTRE